MKKGVIVFLSLMFLLSLNSLAQYKTGVHFGFKAGYNIGTQYGTFPPDLPYDVSSDSRSGFAGGFFLYFPITEAFGVQQEFLYVNKGSRQNISMTEPPLSTSSEYNLNYFELPLVFRYTFASLGPFEIYGSSGFALSMLLDGDYQIDGLLTLEGMPIPLEESGDTDGVDEFDYSFIYALGVEFKLFEQNCFFDYRQTIGWNKLLMPTLEGGEPAPLRNQSYTFTLGIYF